VPLLAGVVGNADEGVHNQVEQNQPIELLIGKVRRRDGERDRWMPAGYVVSKQPSNV
jgi:hypothetical protein